MKKISQAEILAPAGSIESFNAAIRCGADAVYIGGKSFSARQNATNFSRDDLIAACNTAHKSGVKVYQTINTLVFDDQFDELKKEIEFACNCGIDALIVQDIGVVDTIRHICPNMPIHASTQMTIHTRNGALLAKENGISRVVAAREMSKAQLEDIISSGIDIEVFVHGALCMSVSGQCYMSSMIGSRSANRGLCAQACRLPFSAIENQQRFDLSLKDLSIINHLKELSDIGVKSFKIEGRMKRPEYVAAAVTACKAVLDNKNPDMELLQSVFSRSGFTQGYYLNSTGKDMFGTRQKEDVVSAQKVFPQLQQLYKKERKVTAIDFEIDILKGKNTKLKVIDSQNNQVCVTGNVPEQARNKPTDLEQVTKQLSKLGNTVYEIGAVNVNLDQDLVVPASALNNLRRTACEKLDEIRIENYTNSYNINEYDFEYNKSKFVKDKLLRIEVKKLSQLKDVDINKLEYVIVPIDEIIKHENVDINKNKIIVSLPRYMNDENEIILNVQKIKSFGFNNIECQNYSHIKTAKDLNLNLFGGFGLNILNTASLKVLKDFGFEDCTVSFEMKTNQINSLGDVLPFGIIGYGKLPLMLTVNCPVKQAVGCKNCEKIITDRTGRSFNVECSKDSVEILNCDVLYMADRLNEIKGAKFVTLKFNDESSKEINEIIKCYENGSSAPMKNFTRGLYYRGIQ